jgi:hypothetical protein
MRDLTAEEQQELRRELGGVAADWAQRLTAAGSDAQAAGGQEPRGAERMLVAPLARMAVGEQMRRLLADLVSDSAEEAVQRGAGYPELGAAVGASRQAARKRWPHLSISKKRVSEWKQPPGGLGSQAGEKYLGYPKGGA